MPYFFIIFGLVAYVVSGGLLLAALRLLRPPALVFGIVWRVFVLSVAGVLVANAAFLATVLAVIRHADLSNLGPSLRQAVGIASGLSVLLGPFAVSAVGLAAGTLLGVILGLRSRARSRSALPAVPSSAVLESLGRGRTP